DEVVVAWPQDHLRTQAEAGLVDGRTVVCVLTHDPRTEVPLLEVALRLPVAYVGAMGSRRSSEELLAALRSAGLDAELDRLHAPIGLDLGARSAEEVAVSVMAEVIAARERRSGRPLSTLTGPVHARAATPGPASPAAAAASGRPAPARPRSR
ncbi:XdhC family protein, partial [Acinetobacter baumannii]|uniref:XdhC family protein n=1 Tax=Acinetobacter baumannii TaxID=470 RepID=UPI00189B6480